MRSLRQGIGRQAIVGALSVVVAVVLVLPLADHAVAGGDQAGAAEGRSPDAELRQGLEGLLADLFAEASRLRAAGAPLSTSSLIASSQQLQDAVVARTLRLSSELDVQVDVTIEGDGPNRSALRLLGVRVELERPAISRAQYMVPVNQLGAVARLPGVVVVRLPNYAVAQTGAVLTEGDSALRVNLAREQRGLSGQGVRIGVISNGILGLEAAQASGDAPLLADQRAFDAAGLQVDSEGTALIEIIHDLAPDAEILFANAGTDLEMMQAVDYLAARADIVVDDLAFLFPGDQQSAVSGNTAQALNNPAWPIRAYITSVGNWADRHYAARFIAGPDGSTLGLPTSGSVHRFQAAAGTTDALDRGPQSFNEVLLKQGETAQIELFWSDPWGQSTNDYDLYLLNAVNDIVATSNVRQGLPGAVPRERLLYTNDGAAQHFRVVVQNADDAAEPRDLELFVLQADSLAEGQTVLNFNTPAGSILAQSDAPGGVIAVGAISQSDAGLDDIEPYSSRGPTANGVTKPDLTAVDNVSVTGSGDFTTPFLGTSAAAPHVAGIAALLLQAQPALQAMDGGSPSAERTILRSLLIDGAVDLGEPGPDNIFGAGRIDALTAVELAEIDILTVDSAADDGPGSFRLAIETVNTLTQADSDAGAAIVFAAPFTILLQSPLPPIIANNVTIDGVGSVVDGAALNATNVADGLRVLGDDVELAHLRLQNFGGAGLHLDGAARTSIRAVELTTNGTGLLIDAGARDVRIGDTPGASGNGSSTSLNGILAADNGGDGVRIRGAQTAGVRLQFSFIGVDPDGTPRGNGGAGVRIEGGSSNNTIGVLLPGEPQLQTAQVQGLVHTFRGTVTIDGAAAPIGTPVEVLLDGESQGVTSVGVVEEAGRALFVFTVSGPGNIVSFLVDGVELSDRFAFVSGALTVLELALVTDGSVPRDPILPGGNTIAFNGAAGVHIEGAETDGHSVRGNRIHSNGGLDIDLAAASDPASGITPNDAADLDDGPNGLLNRPSIDGIVFSFAGARIEGEARSGAVVDLYVAVDQQSDPTIAANDQNVGGALRFIGTATAQSGHFVLEAARIGDATAITALATDGDGNTSEFARNFAVALRPRIDQVTPNIGSIDGGTVVTLTGFGFVSGPALAVFVGGAVATVEAVTITTMVIRTPPGFAGPTSIAVLNPDGRSAVLLDAFSYALVHFETLQPGWNNITWQGTPTPVTAAIASLAGQLDRVFAWDANRQAFDSFIVAAPSFLNSLTVLEPGQSLWVFLDGDAPAVWEQPLS